MAEIPEAWGHRVLKILINLLIDLFFLNLFLCPNLVVIYRYYSFDTLIKVSSSSSSSSHIDC